MKNKKRKRLTKLEWKVIDFALSKAKFGNSQIFSSGYRLHDQSITGTMKIDLQIREYHRRIFEKILKREWRIRDHVFYIFYKLKRKVLNIKDTKERILKGKSYGRLA